MHPDIAAISQLWMRHGPIMVSYNAKASWDLPVQVGDTLPDATLFEGAPDKKVQIKDVFKGKKGEAGGEALAASSSV